MTLRSRYKGLLKYSFIDIIVSLHFLSAIKSCSYPSFIFFSLLLLHPRQSGSYTFVLLSLFHSLLLLLSFLVFLPMASYLVGDDG